MFDKLKENTSTKIPVKDFVEAKRFIAELQQEIKEGLKEKVKEKSIQPELRSRVKEFIDIDKWGLQIDYTIHSCTKKQIVGSLLKALVENAKENALYRVEQANSLKDIKYKYKETKEKTENLCKHATELLNKTFESLNINECEEDKTVTEYYLEIIDTKESIEGKIDDCIEKLISSAQYPYLKGGIGLRTIVEELGKILEYDSGYELDNKIIEKIHRILQWNFNCKEVECTGSYAVRDFFIDEIKDDIDKNVTTRKAMILEDKYAENPLVIKGHVMIPDNSVPHKE